MHVRFSTCRGINVAEEGTGDIVGQISGILIHPDTGKVEGFFVSVSGAFQSQNLFLSTIDIIRWGTNAYVRSHDVVSPAEDRVRILPLLEDKRTFLGQRIRTESGRKLGRCADVQINTESWRVEWIFPRKFWRWGIALPIVEVVRVRPDAIIVRDTSATVTEKSRESRKLLQRLPEIEASIPQPTTYGSQD